MGDEDENDVEDYQQICEIWGTTSQIGFRRPRIGVISLLIVTRTCCLGDGILSRTCNSLMSEFLMMISPLPSQLSLSFPKLYHHLRTPS